MLFCDQRAKKNKNQKNRKKEEEETAVEEGGKGFVITPPFTGERRAGKWHAVAPGYLEEGLLHSEAGQQN